MNGMRTHSDCRIDSFRTHKHYANQLRLLLKCN